MNPLKKAALGVALVGSTLAGGAIGASFLGTAGAQDSTTTTAPAATAPAPDDGQAPPADAQGGQRGPQGDPSTGGHQFNGITETVLTGDAATQATAAKAAVPDGTVERVENDAEGAAYEAHVAKADGSHVTVKMDSSFKVTSTEDGMR